LTRAIVHTEAWFSDVWHNYVWLRGVRKENDDLKNEIVQMKMREVRLTEDANQARRLQLLLGFKESYIAKTVPAQVISTTGSEFSRAIYIDKGQKDGIAQDMPVITPEGIVGKVLRTFPAASLVLLINDPTSGAGVILEKSRLQGILKGSPNGTTLVHNIMTDEKVEPGDRVLTSGGDRVFPKGLLVGTVMSVGSGQDLFLNIRVKPAAAIGHLEEVLVITKMDERTPQAMTSDRPVRAIDILAQRLPTVAPPAPKPDATEGSPATTNKPGAAGSGTEKKATAVTGTTRPMAGAATEKKAEGKPATGKPVVVLPGATGEARKTAIQALPATKPQDPNQQGPRQ
jgi:rod shape-determining protein MreC